MNEDTKQQKQKGNGVLPRCLTCKYWKQDTFYDYEGAENDGFCSELGSELTIELHTGWGGGYVESIETISTFGCVLHKFQFQCGAIKSTLKPCPICGESNDIAFHAPNKDNKEDVQCLKCGLKMEKALGNSMGAVAWWNKRT